MFRQPNLAADPAAATGDEPLLPIGAQTATPRPLLTKREEEVLALIAFGLTNKEMADRLTLSRRTVETHVENILGKLGAPTRTRAIAEALQHGLLDGRLERAHSQHPSPSHNLPFQLTTLLGREQDLADVKARLELHRLVTLTGSGGVGKTRLALRAGVDLLDAQPGGVWFCDFSPLSGSAPPVAATIARALGVRELPSRALWESIADWLKDKPAIIILDNCEHVLNAAADLTGKLLQACANLRILTTSRQRLGIAGEAVFRVRSLTVPAADADLSTEEASAYGAIALFVDRARAADAGFHLTGENVDGVAEICRRLDGIPLAIELAASRMHVAEVHSVARALDARFSILNAGSRNALPRQQTLWALIDWSYDLLSPAEQLLLERLGVFGSDFDIEAAQAVCAADDLPAANIAELVALLADKSLVTFQARERRERYALLESTRAYALEKLERRGEHERFARRHAEHFRARALQVDDSYGFGSATVWLASVEQDLDNYRAALRWALTDAHDPALGGAITGALERLWFLGGHAVEARDWIGAALSAIDEKHDTRIAARLWRARARFLQGQPMRESAEHALALYASVGDERGAAYALRFLAYSLLQMGCLDEANAVLVRAVAAFSAHDDKPGVASCLGLQGVSAYSHHDYAASREYYVKAIAAYKGLGDDLGAADVLGNLGELEFADGNPEEALAAVTASLAITMAGREMANLAIDHNNRAAYLTALGALDEARTSATEALRWARPERNVWNIAVALQHLALVAALQGDHDRAARILGYVNERYQELALEREATEQWGYERLMSTLREHRSEADIARRALEGTAWSEAEAVLEAVKP